MRAGTNMGTRRRFEWHRPAGDAAYARKKTPSQAFLIGAFLVRREWSAASPAMPFKLEKSAFNIEEQVNE